ncbi:hypothetical protein LZ24_00349 [Desulfobotulus alkaliphilus]|uniref:Secreted protein with PEP-CTERM sorting signal n=1 Tax=Desulfobotulus alkaliphilus TaxID=622671 RepID=A0A562S6C2_9BACT|nr:hypothetical protein [Desulfobotulus alkaliphilus]TWI76728.1 hypothetical protein LZ24_00349 [Desulfobotulus alkaliphilus]
MNTYIYFRQMLHRPPPAAMALFLCLFLAALLLPCTAHSHSTEGRVRIPLDTSRPDCDAFAYFIEPYVNQEKYKGIHQPHMGRFYVMDFHGVERKGNHATVSFEVLDVRVNQRFNDSMDFVRGNDGVWTFMDGDGRARPVFTYIPSWLHFIQLYVQPAAMAGLPLLCILFFFLYRRRKLNSGSKKEKDKDASDEESVTA